MQFHPVDLAIIALYVVITVGLGFWVSRRASRSMNSYFLGGNAIPWWVLGVSNASGMFDISGTMLMVYWLFVYGLKSIWIPFLWPVFNQIFLMIYLGPWLRRSGVMTGAEWITFRFGEGKGAHLSHLIVVAFALLNVIGFLAYGFIGVGKFAATFLPFELAADPELNVQAWGLLITALTTLYVVKGGMFSVVITELFQFVVMTVGCLWMGAIAMNAVSPEMLSAVIPEGWRSMGFGWTVGLDWSGLLPAANDKIAGDGYLYFGPFLAMLLFKGYLMAGAGPAPNYDMQRVLSTRSPREAAKMSGFVNLVLLVPRYMLIAGLTILALVFFSGELRGMGSGVDFETILPFALREFAPVGLLGLLIAALLAAFMSTYAATVNAAPAYIVNDIYRRYVNPGASEKTLVRMSYLTSVLVVIIGTAVGLFVTSLNEIVLWIVGALYGGYTAANVLKWYWWRFNSYGYFWGMMSGMAAAMIVSALLPTLRAAAAGGAVTPFLSDVYLFPVVLLISVAGCILGSLLTPPDDEETLKTFYLKVRPWGFWKPIHDKVAAEHPGAAPNRDFGRDMVNVAIGIAWQTALTAFGVYLVIEHWTGAAIAFAVIAATSLALKFNWYDHLKDYPDDLTAPEHSAPAAAATRA